MTAIDWKAHDNLVEAVKPDPETAEPMIVLSWKTPAERNMKLKAWRRAVMVTFNELRIVRIAWTLEGLFNVKTGYAHPSNTYLANETGVRVNKVQEALATLEKGGAIVRRMTVQRGSQRWRAIYPGATIIGAGVTPSSGGDGHPLAAGVQNLRRRIRMPRSQLDYARAAAERRQT
jgi:hypothetical protein